MNYHKKMHWSASVVKNGFQKVKTLEAFKEADTFINLAENSFVEIIIEQQAFKQTKAEHQFIHGFQF